MTTETPSKDPILAPKTLVDLSQGAEQRGNKRRVRSLKILNQKVHRRALVFTLVFAAIGIFITRSQLGDLLSDRVSSPIEFRIRHWLGRDVAISPKLKILLYDDKTAAKLNKPSLTLSEWARVLEFISDHHPERIYIDQIFGIGFGSSPDDKKAMETIKSIRTPISVGSLISKSKIAFRQELPPSSAGFDLDLSTHPDFSGEALKSLPDLAALKSFSYGPTPEMLPLFSVGHIHYESPRFITPFFKIGEKNLLPHLGLMGLPVKFDGGTLWVNQAPVPLYFGRTAANIGSYPGDFLKVTRSINGVLTRLDETPPGRWEDFLSPGDHVLVIPEGFTGSADFKPGPFGSMLGGWIIASTLNSALTGEWLNVSDVPFLVTASLVAIGSLSALAPTWLAWLGIGFLLFVFPMLGIALFSFASIIVPWLPTTLLSGILAMIIMAMRSKVEREKDSLSREILMESEFMARENALLEENRMILLKEKEEASTIAQAFRPDPVPNWPGFEISAFHRCFDGASGDWYFFEKSQDDYLFHVVLCDITGHGVQAALIVSACKTVLNSFKKYRKQSVDQSTFCLDYLETLNEIIHKQGAGKHTCTMIGITFDVKHKLLHFVTCAHPPALYLSRDRLEERPVQLRTHFNPVGFTAHLAASLKASPWLPGDQITLHTDGIPITDNLRLYRNFLSSFEGEWSQIAPQLYESLWQKIEATKGKKPDDDVSLIMVRMKPML